MPLRENPLHTLVRDNTGDSTRRQEQIKEALLTGFRVIRNLMAVTGVVAGVTMGAGVLSGDGPPGEARDRACQKVSEALEIDQVRFAESRGIAGADIETQTRAWLQEDSDAAAFANLIEAICLPEGNQADG